MLRAEGHGIFFQTAISDQLVTFVAYAFVDDTDLISSANDSEATAETIAADMQAAMDDINAGRAPKEAGSGGGTARAPEPTGEGSDLGSCRELEIRSLKDSGPEDHTIVESLGSPFREAESFIV